MGEGLARLGIAAIQALWIIVGTSLLFDVNWGSPIAATLLVLAFCAVSASAAMVFGALIDNANAASGIGVGVALTFAALGGSMMPLELFPDALRKVSAVTPHFWSYKGFTELTRRGGGVTDILPSLGMLALMTAILLPLGAWLLRKSLNRAL